MADIAKIRYKLPNSKEWVYIGAEQAATGRIVGWTTGMAYARGQAFRASLEAGQPVREDHGLHAYNYNSKGYGDYPFLVSKKPVGNVWLRAADMWEMEIIDARIDVVKKNTIKETSLVHRDGTVKELIQASDYDVTITGHLFSDSKTPGSALFPAEQLKNLNSMLSIKEPIRISSVYTDCFGIDWVVMKQAEFKQSTDQYLNVLEFKLVMASDTEHTFMEG